MRLLLDSDVFCKLGAADLLTSVLEFLGVAMADCGRLAALPHMLRRGSLPRLYGEATCQRLLPIAEAIAEIPRGSTVWLDRIAQVREIDPGEAQLFAVAAERTLLVTTGDKRALRAVSRVPEFAVALAGRLVVPEALLHGLCERLGDEHVRELVQPLADVDKMIKACFSHGNPRPREALRSYFDHLKGEVHPLVLWESGSTPEVQS